MAWEPLGWECAGVAELEPFPCAVLAHHYPSVPNLGDVTKITPEQIEQLGHIDLVVGGSPCFTAGHLVSCVDGYKPIEDIRPGDLVRTHTGAIKPVVRVGGKVAPVGRLSGIGLPSGIVSTLDHKYRSVEYRSYGTRRNGSPVRVDHFSEPDWTPAKDMVGKQWCALTKCESIAHTPESRLFDERQAMYIAGMYLGDGYIRKWAGKSKKAVVLCLNQAKLDKLTAFLGYAPTATKSDNIFKVTFCDTQFANWLLSQFGHLSSGKHIPLWALTHEHRALLLQGYMDTDGTIKEKGGYRVNSVSKSLIFGIADLAITCGYVPSISYQETTATTVIEGRTVNQQNYWSLGLYRAETTRKSRIRHDYLLRKVQSFTDLGREERVYNIEVADDHSYVLDGFVVKNCQDLSVAGKRRGFSDDDGNTTRSGLFFQQLRIFGIARERCGARFLLWENVVGAYSSSQGADFAAVVSHMAGLDGVEVPKGGWAKEGAAVGDNGLLEWACLDAQWFGVAQRRRRVFACLDTGDWSNRPPVLLVTKGLLGNSPPSRDAGKGLAAFIAASVKDGGREGRDSGVTDASPVVSALPLNTMTMQGRPSDLANPRVGSGIGDETDPCPTLTKAHSHAVFEVHGFYPQMKVESQTVTKDLSPCLVNGTNPGYQNGIFYAETVREETIDAARMVAFGEYASDGTASCMKARDYKDATDLISVISIPAEHELPVSVDFRNGSIDANVTSTLQAKSTGGYSLNYMPGVIDAVPTERLVQGFDEVARTLTARHDSSPCSDRGMDVVCILEYDPAIIAFSGKDYGGDAVEGIAPTMRSMCHAGSHANGGGPLAIAYPSAEHVGSRKLVMRVRRLTVREAERLQGFPPRQEILTLNLCLDTQNSSVAVVTSYHKKLNSAWNAGQEDPKQFVPTAESPLSVSQADQEPLAAIHVHMNCVPELQAIHSQGKLMWSASGAGPLNLSHLHTLTASSVQELVLTHQDLVSIIRNGEAVSQQSIRLSIPVPPGIANVERSGPGTEVPVLDAMSGPIMGTFTTSSLGRVTKNSDSIAETLCCSVLRAIAGFIPEKTLPRSFSIDVVVEYPYTLIPWKGKEPSACPDGPRYKALGNSMAVPVMGYIGRQIQQAVDYSLNPAYSPPSEPAPISELPPPRVRSLALDLL